MRFAAAAGDANPLHCDPARARLSRYGELIASGAQSTSMMLGVVATHFSRASEMVGLDFRFWFRCAVYAEQPLRIDWLIVGVRPARRGAGTLVDLRGRLRRAEGKTAVGAKGLVLVSD